MDRFALDKGLRFIEEWTPTLLREMRSSWQLSAATRTSQFSLVKSFFELFVEDKTIPFNPARIRSRRPNRAARNSARRQVNPYTNQQLETMLDLCRQMKPDSCVVRIDQCTTGQDLADFIELSVYTGLRISDMVTFDISRLTDDNQVWLRAATKNGEPVLTWIPDWLAQRVRLRAQRIGPRIFGTRQTEKLCVLTEAWRRKLRPIFQAAGFPSKGPDKATPHRFRHTFVRILLEAHVPVGTVAILAGDTEAMIRKHYSGWIQSRQEQTRQTLEQAFRHVPRSHY
jgi:integrase